MSGSDIELTLCVIKQCHVYKIPPRADARGYKAEEWEGGLIWTGRCRVVGIGNRAEVRLEDPKDNSLFAVCPVSCEPNAPKSVEPVLDSSRYFVLRIEDRGKHAYIGLGFSERSDAFDFNVALRDQQRNVERESEPAPDLDQYPKKDYSLAAGQQIHVQINTQRTTDLNAAAPSISNAFSAPGGSGGNPFFLPPPPSGGARRSGGAAPIGGAPVGQSPMNFGRPAAPANNNTNSLDSFLGL